MRSSFEGLGTICDHCSSMLLVLGSHRAEHCPTVECHSYALLTTALYVQLKYIYHSLTTIYRPGPGLRPSRSAQGSMAGIFWSIATHTHDETPVLALVGGVMGEKGC